MINRASKLSYEAFSKMVGGSLERAYEAFGGFAASLLDTAQRKAILRSCPNCHKTMTFHMLAENPNGYVGRWICSDEAGEPSDWCGYEELTTMPIEEVIEKYAIAAPENAPLIDMTKLEGAPETVIASIYEHAPRNSVFPKPIADWARRRCPTCGTPLVFYAINDNPNATGIFACPNGWDATDDPTLWCGYEQVTNEPLATLFTEYFERSPDKRFAATSLLLKECPWCGSFLVPRPIEANERGWKTRWICQKGFTKDIPELLCGYEELTTETVGSYINAINKIIAESK